MHIYSVVLLTHFVSFQIISLSFTTVTRVSFSLCFVAFPLADNHHTFDSRLMVRDSIERPKFDQKILRSTPISISARARTTANAQSNGLGGPAIQMFMCLFLAKNKCFSAKGGAVIK